MGTRGYYSYRHKRRNCCRYNPFDSYPDGLGLDLLGQIPTDPEAFHRWLENSRKLCEKWYDKADKGIESSDWEVRDVAPHNDLFIEWVYEMDLDLLIFSIDGLPMYCLDHMPPSDIFVDSVTFDHYNIRAPAAGMPEEYSYTRKLVCPPPQVPHSSLDSFTRLTEGQPPTSLHVLIFRPINLLHSEATCTKTLELLIGALLHEQRFSQTLRKLPAQTYDNISPQALWLMYVLTQLAICPSYYNNRLWSMDVRLGRFWWPRAHICVRPSTHLHDEDNLRHSMTELVTEIMKPTNSDDPDLRRPSIVYGIAFSLLKCVLIRVDRENGGAFRYTEGAYSVG
ncbi:hypothetical protein EUX98_g8974 [Antrodiella citrinella]|uniref:Uncharacterized protein n=1 Tax=Antrodiella citrinella TaxID=2447956 RepID=A0A4S4M056_9APHY|nr:hypothetical protein EUX98_g8974 [Antrodiella citrinella]